MNLVQKYIIKEIIPFFLIGNLFFMFLLLMERMVTLADLFFSKNVPLFLLIETIIYLLPSIFYMTIPIAGLLATLIAFSRLSADSELIAMKAIGASNKTLIKPLIFIGIFAGLINLAMGLYFVEKGSTLAYNNLNKIVENQKLILKEPKPFIAVNAHSASSIDFVVRVWCNTEDYWNIYHSLLEEVKITFDKENISIPYPQMDLHLKEVYKK